MANRLFHLVSVLMLFFSIAAHAVEPEIIPGGFPAAQKPAFAKERAALLAEKRTLDGKVARQNKVCAHPKEYQAHKCNTDRLALFKMVDAYKAEVIDFNRRLAAIDRGETKKAVKEEETH